MVLLHLQYLDDTKQLVPGLAMFAGKRRLIVEVQLTWFLQRVANIV